MRTILLIIIGLSSLSMAEFTRINGVVTDSKTTLEWQDDYSDNSDNIKYVNWTDAIDYCEDLGLAGDGWRLPNKKELLSLVDYTTEIPTIDVIFNHIASSNYWSSTTSARYTYSAWVVLFYYGGTYYSSKSDSRHVRCVRSGQ